MKILGGAVVRQDPRILAAHLKTMKWQELRDGHTLDLAYVVDLDIDSPGYREALDLLTDDPDIRPIMTDVMERPAGAEYEAGEDTHRWQIATFQHLARLKQTFLDYAVEHGYDAVFMVDTDLLLDRHTLQSLIDTGMPVVSGVFWTSWASDSPPLPQVWQRHPYELGTVKLPEHKFLSNISKRQLQQVGGLGACTLIDVKLLDKLRYWPFLEGLPTEGMWQGEDRHFCIRANRAHIQLWADPWPDIYHVYRPSYVEHIPNVMGYLEFADLPSADIGDLVSFTLEELDTPALAGLRMHVRGRLGQLELLPEIETDLQSLAPGQECLTRVSFPLHYPVEDLRGQTRLMRIKLLAVKRYLPHIGLPTVVSEFDDRYYTPAQIRTMRASKVLSHEHRNRADTDVVGRNGDQT